MSIANTAPKQPRIPAIGDTQLPPLDVVAAIRHRRGGSLLNPDRMQLNSAAYAVGWNGYFGAVRNSLPLDARLRELAICAVAMLTRAEYEYCQHAPEFLMAGGSQAQLDALGDVKAAMEDCLLFSADDGAFSGDAACRARTTPFVVAGSNTLAVHCTFALTSV